MDQNLTQVQLHKLFMDVHLQFRRRLKHLQNMGITVSQNDYDGLSIMLNALIQARKRLGQ